jgi:DNA-dependent protein kinase catalytic subunit
MDEIYLANGLVKFFMKNCFNPKKEIFKMNLEIVKHLVELWKNEILVPVQLLYDSITVTSDPNSTENLCGLQLNAIVLANGLVPWTDVVQTDFIRAIFSCLDNEKTAIYQPASELLGMCLNVMYPSGHIR